MAGGSAGTPAEPTELARRVLWSDSTLERGHQTLGEFGDVALDGLLPGAGMRQLLGIGLVEFGKTGENVKVRQRLRRASIIPRAMSLVTGTILHTAHGNPRMVKSR
jgi:hypothetical protein